MRDKIIERAIILCLSWRFTCVLHFAVTSCLNIAKYLCEKFCSMFFLFTLHYYNQIINIAVPFKH